MEFDIGRLHRWAKAVAPMAKALAETTHLNADKLGTIRESVTGINTPAQSRSTHPRL